MPWRRNLLILWCGVFVATTSFSIVTPFLPLLVQRVGVTGSLAARSGLIFAGPFFTSVVMSPIWGALADRYGRKIMILRSGLAMTVITAAMAFATNRWEILGLRLLDGVLSGFIPSAIALVATNTPEEEIGSALGLIQAAPAAGNIVGPLLGGLIAASDGIGAALFTAAALLGLATAWVAVGVREQVTPVAGQGIHVLTDLREAVANPSLRRMLLWIALIQATVVMIQPILVLHILRLPGVNAGATALTGLIVSLTGVGVTLAAPLWGRMGNRYGHNAALAAALLGSALFTLPQAVTQSVVWFGLWRFLLGFAQGGLSPLANAIIAHSVQRDFRGRAFGISNSAFMVGFMVGPLTAGWLAGATTTDAVLWASGLSFLALGLAQMAYARRPWFGRWRKAAVGRA